MDTNEAVAKILKSEGVAPLPEPNARGWRSSKPDFPGMVQYTGTSVSSANAVSSALARPRRVPIPDQITGFFAPSKSRTASLTSLGDGV